MRIFYSIIIIVTIIFIFGEAKAENFISFVRPDTNSDSLTIIQLENNWTKALINKDEAIFRKYLSENLVYTENDKLYSRDEVLGSVMSGAETVENAYNEDMSVHIFDKTAIVTGWLYVIGKGSEGKFYRKYKYTDVWLKVNDDWQLIAAHDYIA